MCTSRQHFCISVLNDLFEWQPLQISRCQGHPIKHKHSDLLKNSYDSQHKAVLGMAVITLGASPLPNPFSPSLAQMTLKASAIPLTFRMSRSCDVPFVCKIVFATSRGVVTAAATPPATPPDIICVTGEYSCVGFSMRFICS